MVNSVEMEDARQHLGELLERVERGEQIVISRAGRVPMQIVPAGLGGSATGRRVGGQNLLGLTYAAPDWDAPMSDEELREWGM
jgi:prevent-host-death family protein